MRKGAKLCLLVIGVYKRRTISLAYRGCVRIPAATGFCRVRYDIGIHSTINTLTR
jgi:hypothetical protein